MGTLPGPLDPVDARLTQWVARYGIVILRVALGVVFFWFGVLKCKFMRLTLLLLAFQMFGAASPLLLFPGEVFTQLPYAPTLEGQYIIKNLVLVSAGIVIGATVRGGGLTAREPGAGSLDANSPEHAGTR